MASFQEANIGSLKRSPTIMQIRLSVVNCFVLKNVISCRTTVVIRLFSTRNRYICRKARTRSSWLTSRITLSASNDDARRGRLVGRREDRMQVTTVGNCLQNIFRTVSLSSTGFIFAIVLMQSSQAQDPNEAPIAPREHQEFLRKAREGELVRPGTSQQQQLRLAEIREDFRRIQLVNAEKIVPRSPQIL